MIKILILIICGLLVNARVSADNHGFIENKGQILDQNQNVNPSVKYLLLSPGFNVQVRENGFSYDIYDVVKKKKTVRQWKNMADSSINSHHPDPEEILFDRIDIGFEGINPSCKIIPSGKLPGIRHYYTYKTPAEGITNVSTFQCVKFKNIYPNIDLELISDKNKFKYNIIVNPGGNIASLKMKISGADCSIADDGSIVLSTSKHKLEEKIPLAFYYSDRAKKEIACRFTSSGNNIFSVEPASFIPHYATFVVDPVPTRIWGTYFGDTGYDYVSCETIDNSGKLIVSGPTSSTSNIATSGSFQSSLAGYHDVFISKMDANGYPIWSTYYGGEEWELSQSVCCDVSGEIYITGETHSETNIASPGAYMDTLIKVPDAFLARFSTSGMRVWSTYYGGNEFDYAYGCALDNNGDIYMVGETISDSGITTPGSYQPVFAGGSECFIAKFTNTGSRIWCSYYGGNLADGAYGCTVDNQNNLVIAGATSSPINIASPGAWQTTLGNPVFWNSTDGFIAKFNSSGQRLWGTYYGGENDEWARSVQVDQSNNIVFSGSTNSLTNISSPGSFQPVFGGYRDGFLVKFSPAGSRLWGTYIGGTQNDEMWVASSAMIGNNIIATGTTWSSNGIATPDAYQPTLNGATYSSFIMKFTASGSRLWGTYYGDTSGIRASVCVGDTIFIGGSTVGSLNIVTPGAYQTSFSDTVDGFIAKFVDCPSPDTSTSFSGPDSLCLPLAFPVTFTIAPIPNATLGYVWEVPAGATIVTGQNTTSITVDFGPTAVSGYVYVRGINNCWMGERNKHWVKIKQRPVPVVTGNFNPCAGVEETYISAPGKTNYFWDVSPGGTVTGGGTLLDDWVKIIWNTTGGQLIQLGYTDINGCSTLYPEMFPVTITNGDSLKVAIVPSANSICAGTQVTYTATPSGAGTLTYNWKVNGVSQGANSPTFNWTPANGEIITCQLSSSQTTCIINNPATSNAIVMNVIPQVPVLVTVSASQNPVCAGAQVTLNASQSVPGNLSYLWLVNDVPAGSNLPSYTYTPADNDKVKCVLQTDHVCAINNPDTSNIVTLTVTPLVTVDVTIVASVNPVCGGIPVTFTANPVNGGVPVYQWKLNGANAGLNQNTFTYAPAAGDVISCIINSSLSCTTKNPDTSNSVTMSVIASPVVTYSRCTDTITSVNAKPFRLRGGIPLGGTYSGPGVNSLTGMFNPATAGIGNKTITYSYTNSGSCADSKTRIIRVISSPVFTCGNTLTDIRDNKTYATTQIGAQCWMAEDLRYGTSIPQTQHQRDNCSPETYQTTNSQLQTTNFYQWDEIMDYTSAPGDKGICPPGWHIPTETEWQTLFSNWTNSGFAGSALKYSGFSGFDANLKGIIPGNAVLQYSGFAVFYWTSTAYGPYKAWAHAMNDIDPSVSLYPSSRQNAFSLRCIKD